MDISSKHTQDQQAMAQGQLLTPLGNITESAAYSTAESRENLKKFLAIKVLRYKMREQSSATLGKFSRVCTCNKIPSYSVQNSGASMGISKNADGCRFYGVANCGSHHTCPTCAVPYAMHKKDEVLSGLATHRKEGGATAFVTLTVPHYSKDNLSDVMKGLRKALSSFKANGSVKKRLKSLSYIGQIRNFDLMHGQENGWHPHTHEIWFFEKPPTTRQLRELEDFLYNYWRSSCLAAGLSAPSRKHGLRIDFRQTDSDSSDDPVGSYVSKFADELTLGLFKEGKKGSRTPWGILKDLSENWTLQDSKLWTEYADAIKGTALLYWSPGLKKRLLENSDNLTSVEIVNKPDDNIVHILQPGEFRLVVRFHAYAYVLHMAEIGKVKLAFDRLRAYAKSLEIDDRTLRKQIYWNTVEHLKKLAVDGFGIDY